MKLLVTGGRDYAYRSLVWKTLDEMHEEYTIESIIHGACPTGVDCFADEWAKLNDIPVDPYPAKWKRPDGTIDYAAGPKRNSLMVKAGRPNRGLAFPGGSGTADMVRKLKAAGILVREIK